jgi:phage terminase large subunit
MINVNFNPPAKLAFFYTKKATFKIAYGGRGSGKSTSAAMALVIKAVEERHTILCARSFQNSITDSVHKLLTECIDNLQLNKFFNITKTSIATNYRGNPSKESSFIFKGLQKGISEIKSIQGLTICWVEEAEAMDARTWDLLLPCVRKKNSETWITFNPRDVEDATYQMFVVNRMPDSIVEKVNYYDNPFFSQTNLPMQMEYCKIHNYEKYKHIWLGEPKALSDALVFTKWKIEKFEETPLEYCYRKQRFFGVDFGWNDPNTCVRCYVVGNKLYISHEVYQDKILMDRFSKLLEQDIPDIKNPRFTIYADSSRPDLINDLYRTYGFKNIQSVKKTTKTDDPNDKLKSRDYVKAGIDFLKTFEIIIHPRCEKTIEEFRNYKWQSELDANGENLVVLDKLEEKGFDHCIDALRYAVAPLFLKRKSTMADIARSITLKHL